MEKEEQCHLIRFLNYVVLSNSENYENAKIENIKPRHHQLLDLISTNGRTCKKKSLVFEGFELSCARRMLLKSTMKATIP